MISFIFGWRLSWRLGWRLFVNRPIFLVILSVAKNLREILRHFVPQNDRKKAPQNNNLTPRSEGQSLDPPNGPLCLREKEIVEQGYVIASREF